MWKATSRMAVSTASAAYQAPRAALKRFGACGFQ